MKFNLKQLLLSNQTDKQILIKNTFWLGVNEIFSKLIMFAVTVMLGRYFGLEDFGIYNYAFSAVAILMILSDLGVMTIMIREIAKDKSRAEEYLGNAMGIRIITSIIILFLAFLLLQNFTDSKGYSNLIMLATLYSLSIQFQGIFVSVLVAFEKMEYVFICKAMYFLGVFISTLIVIYFGLNMNILVTGYILVGILSTIVAVQPLKKLNIKVKVIWKKTFWKELLKESLPLFGFIACTQIYLNLDTLIIGKYFGNQEVGLYSAAYKILFAFQGINIINAAAFSRMAVLIHEKKYVNLRRMTMTIIRNSIFVLVPFAAIVSLKSELVMKLVWGNDNFVGAAPILSFFIWVGVANYFRVLISNLLITRGQQKYVFYSIFIGLIANAILNIFFMPRIGYTFSATTLLISEIVILVSTLLFLVFKNQKPSETTGQVIMETLK